MSQIKVGIIMGSQSDWPTMQEAANILDDLGFLLKLRLFQRIVHLIACGNMEEQLLSAG